MTSRTTVRKRAGAPVAGAAPQPTGPQIVGRRPTSGIPKSFAFFGPPKTGKTTLATSGKNVLLVQFDPEGDASSTLQGREDITIVEPTKFKEVDDIVRQLATTDAGVYEWVVFDSLTFFFQMVGGREISVAYMNNTNIMRPYGKAGAPVCQIIADAVRLKDIGVVFTAHLAVESEDEVVKLEQTLGESEVKLAVTPMVWKVLGPAVSAIGRTYKTTEYDKAGNKLTRYRVSFNDGERSPAGARTEMPAELNITTETLANLKGGKQ